MPKVSIVVPSYNRADFIAQTIESILAQSFRDFDLLFIDDGSTDKTEDIVRYYAERDARVQYHYQANEERARARTHGVELADSDYVAFVDSDDIWYPHKLAEQVDVLDALSEMVLVYSAVDRIDMQGKHLPPAPRQRKGESGFVFFDLLRRNMIPSVTPMARLSTLKEVGAQNTELIPYEDWDYWLRVARRGEFYHIPESLGAYRLHPQQSVQNVKAERIEEVTIQVLDDNTTREALEEYLQSRFGDGRPPSIYFYAEEVFEEAYSLAYLRLAYWYLLAEQPERAKQKLALSAYHSTGRSWDWRWHGLSIATELIDWDLPGLNPFVKAALGALH